VPNLGVLVELLLVFPEFLEVVLTEVVKPLLVTCVVRVECSLQLRFGEDGIDKSILSKRDTLLLQLLLLQVLFPLFLLVVTELLKFLQFPLLLKIDLNHMKRLEMLLHS